MTAPSWWPLPNGEAIGDQRARELVQWLRTVAPAAVEQARACLAARYPASQQRVYAARASELADMRPWEGMRGICIGSVSVSQAGGAGIVGIALQRDGQLAITVSTPGVREQRWIVVSEERS